MATQDELRELVAQTLEAKGVLGSIRVRGDARARPQAHLRAAVYTAIDEHERESGVHLENPRLAPLKSAHEGRIALGLVGELLDHYGLSFSKSCFLSELGLHEDELPSRAEVAQAIGLAAPSVHDRALLVELARGGPRLASVPEPAARSSEPSAGVDARPRPAEPPAEPSTRPSAHVPSAQAADAPLARALPPLGKLPPPRALPPLAPEQSGSFDEDEHASGALLEESQLSSASPAKAPVFSRHEDSYQDDFEEGLSEDLGLSAGDSRSLEQSRQPSLERHDSNVFENSVVESLQDSHDLDYDAAEDLHA